ncbi:hypothetical protein GCM10010149_61210 [Nonomuraea roseoviolacea subsp. roseoviolacea]
MFSRSMLSPRQPSAQALSVTSDGTAGKTRPQVGGPGPRSCRPETQAYEPQPPACGPETQATCG